MNTLASKNCHDPCSPCPRPNPPPHCFVKTWQFICAAVFFTSLSIIAFAVSIAALTAINTVDNRTAVLYDTTEQPAGAQDTPVEFSNNQFLGNFIAHVPGTASVVFEKPGLYHVDWTVNVEGGPWRYGLTLDGIVVPGSVYGSNLPGLSTVFSSVRVLEKNSVLQLRNLGATTTAFLSNSETSTSLVERPVNSAALRITPLNI